MSTEQNERYEESATLPHPPLGCARHGRGCAGILPGAKYTIGPPIENGFYYDFDIPQALTAEDLEKIEKRMRQIIAGGHPFVKKVVSAEEARKIFNDQPYKLELIDGLEKGGLDEYGNPLAEKPEISIYQSDTFTDLCRGPHVENTRQINPSAFKLMSIAGAYWRGDEHNKMLHPHLRHRLEDSRTSLRITSRCSRKPRRVTTASWGRTWRSSSLMKKSGPACRCGCPAAV